MLKAESEFQERELIKMEREREIKDKGGLRPLVESNRHMTHIDFTNFLKIG